MADRIDGQDDLKAALRAFEGLTRRHLGRWLYTFHDAEVMRRAKGYTPVRRGILRNSGRVLPTTETGSGGGHLVLTSRGGFGGPAKKYAFVQHEDLWWSRKLKRLVHKKLRHTTGRAKFYATAIRETKTMFRQQAAMEWGRLLRLVGRRR